MTEHRNDHQHFPQLNGPGHARRKVVNQPLPERFRPDPYEMRAIEMIAELDRWMRLQQRGLIVRGDPGE